MSRESVITLSIGESGSPPSFNFHVFVDGEVVAGNQSLSTDESKAVQQVSRRYNGLFEQRYRPPDQQQGGRGDTLHNLASIDLNQGEYEEARKKFETVLEMKRQIGDKAGVADTLHQLAAIDMERGEYDAARKKFETALKIDQQIGDRAGVAATLSHIGIIMATKEGRAEEGLRLATLSATILKDIGHADLERVEPWVDGLASDLEYSQDQFDALLQEVAESYQKDRGRSLIDAAFGDA